MRIPTLTTSVHTEETRNKEEQQKISGETG